MTVLSSSAGQDKNISSPESVILIPFFEQLAANIVPYCVLRNYNTLPHSVPGSDVDLLIPDNYLNTTIQILLQCVENENWSVQQRFEKNYHIHHFRLVQLGNDGLVLFLFIDLITDIGLGPIHLISGEQIVKDKRLVGEVYVPALIMEKQINILNAIYTGIPLKQRYREVILSQQEEYPNLKKELSTYLGKSLASKVVESISFNNEFLLKNDARKALKRYAIRNNFLLLLKDFSHYIKVQFSRILYPPGLMVVLLGPDGIGKSTVATVICDRLEKLFPGITLQHLRPHLIPGLGEIVNKEVADNTINQNKDSSSTKIVFWKSFVRMIYYSIDYTIGYWFRIRPDLARGKLIVFDRYYYDYYVDHNQKGVHLPEWLMQMICFFFPSPHKVFVLSAGAKEVHRRRADLDEKEIERQVKGYTKLREKFNNVYVLNADRTADEIVKEIINIMFVYKK